MVKLRVKGGRVSLLPSVTCWTKYCTNFLGADLRDGKRQTGCPDQTPYGQASSLTLLFGGYFLQLCPAHF